VVRQQAVFPQGSENASLDPLLKAVVGGRAGAEAGRVQRFPLAAGAQDEQNGFHAYAVGRAWPAAAEAVGVVVFGK
jgi:hypothetical protein